MSSPTTLKGPAHSSMDPSAKKPQGLSVRVVVRVRPITGTDTSRSCTCLSVDPDRQHVSLSPPDGARAGHKYSFDAALTDAATQEEVYEAAGVQQLVQAAAQGALGPRAGRRAQQGRSCCDAVCRQHGVR